MPSEQSQNRGKIKMGKKSQKMPERNGLAKNKGSEAIYGPDGQLIEVDVSMIPESLQSAHLRAIQGKASPREAIKAHCYECVAGIRREITLCTAAHSCPLYRYRPFQDEEVKK